MELEPEGIITPDTDPHAGPDPLIASIEQALDSGREDEALELCEQALAAGDGDRLDLLFLAGDALMAMGRPAEAEQRFLQVLEADPGCPSSRCWLAMALYRQCRFGESEVAAQLAMDLPDAVVDAQVVWGLLLERRAEYTAADELFRRAAATDPDKYHAPIRLTRAEFDKQVKKAARRLPRQFRTELEKLPVIVQDIPAEELLRHDDGIQDPDLLGLFDGVPLPDTAELGAGKPNRIYLFQRNIERYAKDRDDLIEQIHITLYHELGHYLGFEEDDMDDLGLA